MACCFLDGARQLDRFEAKPFAQFIMASRNLTQFFVLWSFQQVSYESLMHPLTIISTLPSASVGAMLALMLFKIDLNVISIIGIILLIGIVKKNAIMMIDFALAAERNEGKSHHRCHLRSLHAPLPPHPDDHHGGHLRRPAAGLRHRHWIGAAPPSGHHHCRRPDYEPVAHSLHHPGRLSVP